MTVTAHDVARALRERQPGIQRARIQKLLYYCQGWHLALFDEPLFDEPLEAWARGPVVPQVWRADRHGESVPPPVALPESGEYVVAFVLGRYGGTVGRDLIDQTHDELPWRDAWQRGQNSPIDLETLQQHFAGEPETAQTVQVLERLEADESLWEMVDKLLADDDPTVPAERDTPEAVARFRASYLAEHS